MYMPHVPARSKLRELLGWQCDNTNPEIADLFDDIEKAIQVDWFDHITICCQSVR